LSLGEKEVGIGIFLQKGGEKKVFMLVGKKKRETAEAAKGKN